jgi:hypothetical protein
LSCAPSILPSHAVEGRTVRELRRIGKRIAIGVDGDLSGWSFIS